MAAKKAVAPEDQPLTPKQEAFCREWPVDCNGKQAAIRAGFSPRTAAAQAARMLTKVNVKKRIKEILSRKAAECELTVEWVLKRLKAESRRKGEGASHGARVKALELLGKYLKMFVERMEHTGKDGDPIKVIEITKVKEKA